MRRYPLPLPALLVLPLLLASACDDSVPSEGQADLAFAGLATSIDKATRLGFLGYSAAVDSKLWPQETLGDVSGTLVVSGQVEEGSSDDESLHLDMETERYSDLADLDEGDAEVSVTYWTDTESGLPSIDLELVGAPDGTFHGTLAGTFRMMGDLHGNVTLELEIDGVIESDGSYGTRRVEDSMTVTGTATDGTGDVYEVDVTF
jgi:hypothetical protein